MKRFLFSVSVAIAVATAVAVASLLIAGWFVIVPPLFFIGVMLLIVLFLSVAWSMFLNSGTARRNNRPNHVRDMNDRDYDRPGGRNPEDVRSLLWLAMVLFLAPSSRNLAPG